jgi:hypothetical protein
MATETPADELQALFDSLVAKHGPLFRLSALDTEVIGILAKMLITVRTADPVEVPKIAATIAQLTATLPTPVEAGEDDFRLERLSDAELSELHRLQLKCCDMSAPHWVPPRLPSAPELGPCAAEALKLGKFLDLHREDWKGRPLLEAERIELMNGFAGLGYVAGIITRNLWEPIWRSEIDLAVSKAVIATEDRLTAKVEAAAPSTPAPAPSPASNVYEIGNFRTPFFGDNPL